MPHENPAIALIGPGAIGTTIAAALHAVGRTPLLCGRSAQEQLTLRIDGRIIVVPGPMRTVPGEITRKVDLLFVAVKATQIEAASPWLSALCDARTVVCILQNGVEQREQVAPHLHPSHVLPSVVWFPAQRETDGSVTLRGKAQLTLPDTPMTEVVLAALEGTFCSVEVVADFSSIAWRKLLQNSVAGLMALTGRRAGMFSRDDISALSLSYLREGVAVARAEGVIFGDEVPLQILEKLKAFPVDLGTSILADREANRPLEWDIRNGVIQRLGRLHGIPTPISDILVPLLAAASDGPG